MVYEGVVVGRQSFRGIQRLKLLQGRIVTPGLHHRFQNHQVTTDEVEMKWVVVNGEIEEEVEVATRPL